MLFPGLPVRIKMKKGIGNEWEALEEIQEVNSADQIDQLNALRFKYRQKSAICIERKVGKFRETKCRVWGRKSERRNLQQIWGRCGKIEIGSIGKHGAFARMPFSVIPAGGP